MRLAKAPDTLSWNFTILRARSATLLSNGTRVSVEERRNWSASVRMRVARFHAFRWASVQGAGPARGGGGPAGSRVNTSSRLSW